MISPIEITENSDQFDEGSKDPHVHLSWEILNEILIESHIINHIKVVRMFSDTETDMLGGEPPSASCVQGSDDSRNSAIRIAYRTLLRSSSLWEPRYPSLRIWLMWLSLVRLLCMN